MMKDLLKKGREQKEISTRTLSKIINVDQALISKYENGHRIPTFEILNKLAITLEIDCNQLLVAWYKAKLLNHLDFNSQTIQAITEILEEKGISISNDDKRENKIADILNEIENLKFKLNKL
jgi:transcriptional regulator with XRE-family HTH domain